MKTEPEMLDIILQTAKSLNVETVALSGSRTNDQVQKDEFIGRSIFSYNKKGNLTEGNDYDINGELLFKGGNDGKS